MTTLPLQIRRFTGHLLYAVVTPVFFLVFMLVYQPALFVPFFSEGWLLNVNLTLVSSILLVILWSTRLPLFFIERRHPFTWLGYILYMLGEMIVASLFVGLYMCLISRGVYGYFYSVGMSLSALLLVGGLAYLLLTLLLTAISPNDLSKPQDPEMLLRFVDSTGRLKLVVTAGSVLFVKAEENYVIVHYLNGEREVNYSLRQSMRGIEDMLKKKGLVRSHRSYFINPAHVASVRKNNDGTISAILQHKDIAIPVSSTYHAALLERL